VLELIEAGGWLMIPILACSVIALAIIAERLRALRRPRVAPEDLVIEVWQATKAGELSEHNIEQIRSGSALGRILAAGLSNRHLDRVRAKEAIEEVGRSVVHELERYLTTLGTIASITPLLGLLGTVIGMIKVFAVITTQGVGDPSVLAGGISEALITTATGITVAIPSLFFYRLLRGRVDTLVITMEQEALKMLEALRLEGQLGGGGR
jgi:biopolymer transport protein ExbB